MTLSHDLFNILVGVLYCLFWIWKPDLVERGCFIYLDPNLSTHESSCSDSILSGSTRHDTRPSICAGQMAVRLQHLEVNSYSICAFFSHAWVFYSFRSGAATAAAAAGLPVPLNHALGRWAIVAYIAIISALYPELYPIFLLVRWRVYKGLEVVIGQGITNGHLSPNLITGCRKFWRRYHWLTKDSRKYYPW